MTDIDITIPDDQWMTPDDDGDTLIASIHINGVMFHFTAIAVHITEPARIQVADGDDAEFGALCVAFNAEGFYQTTTIRGREYVLFGDAAQ